MYRLEQDIGFGNNCGFQSLAVLTGAATLQSIENNPVKHEIPDYYLPAFSDFVQVCADLTAIEVINKSK